jgi:hypothetical protein
MKLTSQPPNIPTSQPLLLFATLSFAIAAAAAITFRSAVYAQHPDVLAYAFTFDLTLTIPLFYWLLVVRRGAAPAFSIIPVFVVAMIVASRIVPRDQQAFLHQLKYLIAPLELALIAFAGRYFYTHRSTNPAVRFALFELRMIYYAIFCWGRKAPAGFTIYKRSGWGSIVAVIMLLIAGESVALHLFIQQWSPIVAWIITALDIYGVLWLLGDYNAIRLHPITIEDGVLRIRHGFRWSVDVPLTNIASVERVSGPWQKRRDTMNLAMLDDPELLIRLREPQKAAFIMGMQREINAIAMLPDQDLGAAITRAASRDATS